MSGYFFRSSGQSQTSAITINSKLKETAAERLNNFNSLKSVAIVTDENPLRLRPPPVLVANDSNAVIEECEDEDDDVLPSTPPVKKVKA